MGKGGKTFLKKSFSLPSPNPILPFPKTFALIESLSAAFPDTYFPNSIDFKGK
ncbi:hypothetical protein WCP94_001510 [Bilophila wadsworthia]